MVLMQGVRVVSQDDVRDVFCFEVLEEIFYFGPIVWKIAISEFLDDDLFSSRVRQKEIGTLNSLGSSLAGRPHHNPAYLRGRVFGQPSEDPATAADVYIIALRPHTH